MDFSTKWKLPHGAAWKDIVPTRYVMLTESESRAHAHEWTRQFFAFLLAVYKEKYVSKQITDERYFKKEWCLPLILLWENGIFTVWFVLYFSSKENKWKIWFFFEVTYISNLFWYIFFFLNSWKYWCCGKYCRCFLLVMSHTHFEDVTHRW